MSFGRMVNGKFGITKRLIPSISAQRSKPELERLEARNLLSANSIFVNGVYKDLLQRPADPSGLAQFTSELDAGKPRSQVVLEIENSDEFRTVVVSSLFVKLLNRDPDQPGLDSWVNAMRQGGRIEEVSAGMMGSPEYYAKVGGSNDAFLDSVYFDALGRFPDDSGRATWNAQLNSGIPRNQVALKIVSTTEAYNFLVDNFYQDYLNRHADGTGQSGYVQSLVAGSTDQQVTASIIGSDEFFTKVQANP